MTIKKKILLFVSLFALCIGGILVFYKYNKYVAYKQNWKNYYDNYLGLHYSVPKNFTVIPATGGNMNTIRERRVVVSDMPLNEYKSPTESSYLVKPKIETGIGGTGEAGIYKGMYITIELSLDDEYISIDELLDREGIKKVESISKADTYQSEYTFKRDNLKGKMLSVYLRKNRRLYSVSGHFQDTEANNKLFEAIVSTIRLADLDTEKKLKSEEYVPVDIQAENAYLKAKDVSLVIDGQLLHLPSKFTYLSVPISDEQTSMEMTWNEKGINRRLYIDFKRDKSTWWVSGISVSDAFGQWIRFKAFKGAEINKEMSGEKLEIVSQDGAATIWLTDYHLQPFTYNLPPPEASGYRLIHSVQNGKIKLFYNSKHDGGYGVLVDLYDKNGNKVTDKDIAYYKWSLSDPEVLNFYVTRLGYVPFQKVDNPGTESGIEFDGNKIGKTTVTATAFKKGTDEYLASTSFEVSIVDKKEFGL